MHANYTPKQTYKQMQDYCDIVASLMIYRGSYMSAHVLLNLLNELRKRDKMQGLSSFFYIFIATSLINSIIRDHEC